MDRFFADAAKGSLPALTWITPRQGVNKSLGALGGPNSDHPNCCDVALGERLRKDIYEAVRAGPGWNETVVLFTWDDPARTQTMDPDPNPHPHPNQARTQTMDPSPTPNPEPHPNQGGFYDHVAPPMRAPAPDAQPACFCGDAPNTVHSTCDGSDPRGHRPYTRLGSRVPVILVSPWLRKGTVVSEPDASAKPFSDSQYDGTSIAATVKRLFGLPDFLTRRDAWAASFDHLFDELPAPRTDAPMHLAEAPPPTARRGGQPYGTDCDDPSRRMCRSMGAQACSPGSSGACHPRLEAPSRLHQCTVPSRVYTASPVTPSSSTPQPHPGAAPSPPSRRSWACARPSGCAPAPAGCSRRAMRGPCSRRASGLPTPRAGGELRDGMRNGVGSLADNAERNHERGAWTVVLFLLLYFIPVFNLRLK